MPLRALAEAHATAKAQFGKLAEARSMLDQAKTQLGDLTRLGDMITPEDVIKAAGRLVASGLSPMAMAKLLSDMPEKGDQLQAWLGQHVQDLAQREQQLDPVLEQMRHSLGVAAMRSLVGHSLLPSSSPMTPAAAPAPGPSEGNALAPAAAPAGGFDAG